MTRMTGPDCVVMCNLINTYIHTYIHTLIVNPESLGDRSSVEVLINLQLIFRPSSGNVGGHVA